MKTILFASLALICGLGGRDTHAQEGAGEKPSETGLVGPYLGQPVPGKEPKLFAPGVVSGTGATISACCFSPDGEEFYFTNQTNQQIMVCQLTEKGWTPPAPAAFSAGYHAFEPHVTHDNKRVYWNWNHPDHAGGPAIFVSVRTADGWTEPTYVGLGMFVSSDRDGRVYVTHFGAEIDFVSQAVMADGKLVGYEDLKGGIEKLRDKYNAIAHPCISPDGSYLVCDVEGGWHLFVSFKGKDGTWGEAIDLAQHDLDVKAGMASITPDGKYLFFSIKGQIYWVSTQIIEYLRPKER